MGQIKIFGREPALWIALVGAVLTWLAGFQMDWLSTGQAVAITSALTGLIIAATTRPIAPGLYVAAVGALAAMFAEYGLHWSEAAVTGLGGIILTVFALFGVRAQATPAADPAPTALGRNAGQVR